MWFKKISIPTALYNFSATCTQFIKKSKWSIAIIAIGLILSLPLFSSGYNPGHDYTFHTYRYMSTANSLQGGQIIPQVDPEMLDGFGYSWNMFYGPLSSYFVTFIRLFTYDWVSAINLFTSLTIIVSGLVLYRFLLDVTKKKVPSFLGAVIYMAAPYHLLDIYIRQAQGELLPFIFAPILLHGLFRLFQQPDAKHSIKLITIGATGTLLSHNLSVLLVGLLGALYILLNIKKVSIKTLRNLVASGALTVVFSAFYLFPLLELKASGIYSVFNTEFTTQYMSQSANDVASKTVDFARFLFNPAPITGGGDEVMPFAIGIVAFFGIILFFIIRKNLPKNQKIFCNQLLIIAGISLVLASPIAPWSHFPSFTHSIQFPWRLLMLSTLSFSIVAAVSLYTAYIRFIPKPSKQQMYIFIATISCVVIFAVTDILSFATYNVQQKEKQPIAQYSLDYPNDNRARWIGQYSPYSLIEDSTQEGEKKRRIGIHVIGTLGDLKGTLPKITGDGTLVHYTKDALQIRAKVDTQSISTIELPLIYYPGYSASLSVENTSKILSVSPSEHGLVKVTIPSKTKGAIHVDFSMSVGTKTGVGITAGATLLCLVSYVAIRLKKVKNDALAA